MIVAALCPHSDDQIKATTWIEEYFELFADKSPDSEEVQLAICFKKDVWRLYRKSRKQANEGFISYSLFVDLWNSLFPNYLIRPWLDVPGKCEVCYEIDTASRSTSDKAVQEALRQCHHMHRGGMFMQERRRYKDRVRHAEENPDTVFSCIIDIMDQSHTRVPYLGSQDALNHPLKQMLQGVLVHGQKHLNIGLTLFRAFANVPKCASLTVYTFLRSLEDWRRSHGNKFPKEIYLQIDGGGENANKTFLAVCEYIVSKRLTRTLWLTRLPTGHTHEDIDACFAHVWKYMRQKPCETIDDYKKKIEEIFSDYKCKAKVEDVYIIPDYDTFFEDVLDKNLADLHKKINTQHQWKFEAVKSSPHFPLGCKTTYRAYSSDKVVEFEKKPKASCVSPIGQLTGLEPTTSYTKWYPSIDNNLPGRAGIEGFYLLRGMPSSDQFAGNTLHPIPNL
jgi:hypothetical protein